MYLPTYVLCNILLVQVCGNRMQVILDFFTDLALFLTYIPIVYSKTKMSL